MARAHLFRPVIGWLIVVLIFELLSFLVSDPLLLPSTKTILGQAASLLGSSLFYADLTSTMVETVVAITFAVVSGVPIGLALGRFGLFRQSLESPLDWLRSIPATALFPVFLLFFGLGRPTRISIATYAAFFAVMLPAMYGSAGANLDRIRHFRRVGFGHFQIFLHIILWEALPSVLAGIRLAVSSALVLVVVGEMFIGANEGLGFRIVHFQERYDTAAMYATVFLVGILGYILNRIILLLERNVAWTRNESAGT